MRRPIAFAATLAAIAGYADATAYLRSHLFVANLTGNTVLLAIALGTHDLARLWPNLVVIGGFVGGAFATSFVPVERRPPVAFIGEAISLAIAAFSGYPVAVLFPAMAMGAQTVAMASFAGVAESTAFLSGDYANAASALATYTRSRDRDARRTMTVLGPTIVAYVAGAVIGASASAHRLPFSLFVPSAVAMILAIVALRDPLRTSRDPES